MTTIVTGQTGTRRSGICGGCGFQLPHCAQWCSVSRSPSPRVGDWVADGNCGDVDMDPVDRDQTLRAKLTCLLCPVRVQCLKSACANREPQGIWGGATTGERSKMGRNPTEDQIDSHFDKVAQRLEKAGL